MQTDWECFRDAVVLLAGGGPVKQRLADAFQVHLKNLDVDSLPHDLRGPFCELVAAVQNGQRVGALDAVSASVRKMSEVEAARHAQSIVHMFANLHDPTAANRPAALRVVQDVDDEIPAFLNRA